jgi:hypothetical protein
MAEHPGEDTESIDVINVDDLTWEKQAFFKLASLGAIVFLPTSKGKYLMQVADADDESEEGKLRPPGGGKNRGDKSLRHTIVRELQEEFALSKKQIDKNLTFLGYEYRKPFWGNAVFELSNHGLAPGEYQASNSPDEKVTLVEASCSDSDYVGPEISKLLSEEEKQDAETTDAETKAALHWDLFKEAAEENLLDLFKPDFSPAQMEEKRVQARLYHRLLPHLASMDKWPKDWTTDNDPQGWVEWYEQYHSGRRSPDDAWQIRRWLNFKARHGKPFSNNPTPRRGWALVNWGIDPLELLDPKLRTTVEKKMEDYQRRIDDRYHNNSASKEAASVGLEKFANSEDYEAKRIQELTEAGHGRWIGSCGHVKKQCRCPSNSHPDLQFAALSPCNDCMKKKKGSFSGKPQGLMGGNSIDGGAPGLVPPPVADNGSMWSERLKQLRTRRGELSDGTLDPTAMPVKPARFITHQELIDIGDGILDPMTLEPMMVVSPSGDKEDLLSYVKKQALHERVIYSAREGKCPKCGASEHEDTSIVKDKIRCGSCGKVTSHVGWGVSKVPETGYKAADAGGSPGVVYDEKKPTAPIKPNAMPVPPAQPVAPVPNGSGNISMLPATYFTADAQSAKSATALGTAGPSGSDTPSLSSAADVKTPTIPAAPTLPSAPKIPSPPKTIAPPAITDTTPKLPESVMQDQQAALSPTIGGQAKAMGSSPTIAETAYPSGAAPPISQGLGALPMGTLGSNTPMMAQQRMSLPQLQKTAMTIDAAGIPTTGPESILYALHNLDLAKKEAEAKDILHRKLKSKRPAAVKTLGFIEGMKRAGIKPHELMLTRVPVIPPQFRPYTVSGDHFGPGDANELYRDLINLIGTHAQIEERLGVKGAGPSRLNLYDAVRAVYGYGEPTSPKTRERGVSGFLKKVTGYGPKFSYPQARMLAKDMDYVGRSVIGVDPDLGLDQIGIPDEMAWKLYAPYVQRRLVRSGMSPEQAIKHITERHELAGKMLDLEMKDRPVVYGRQPSWHKFNVIGGWPKRIPGNMIRINALVTTGLNADFDGDTMNVHLPSMAEAVDDAKNKLMPSRMLFSIKNRDQVVPTPKQEFVLGLYQAQRRLARKTAQFPDEKSALAAVRRGDVSLSDEVVIGGKPIPTPAPTVPDEPPTVVAPASLDERVTK